jgi:hypothetical protein
MFALATGVLAWKTATISQEKAQAQTSAAQSGADVAALKQQVKSLQAETSRMKAQPAPGGPDATPQPTAGPALRHGGRIELSPGGPYLDLDSPDSDPQWQSSAYPEIRYVTGRINITAQAVYLGDTKADYNSCRNKTGYTSNDIDISSVSVGKYMCVKTSEKRYAAMKILELTPNKVTFDVTVYDPPDET